MRDGTIGKMRDHSKITVGKLDGARRQLQMAIWLRFKGGDPVAIHALCAGAYEVIERLNAAAGGEDMFKGRLRKLAKQLKTKDKELVLTLINAPENFLKHAARDPHETSELDPKWTDGLLFQAAVTCTMLLGKWRPLLRMYILWYGIHYRNEVEEWKEAAKDLDLSRVPTDAAAFFRLFAPLELPARALNDPPVC
jgi:hypothetical protein